MRDEFFERWFPGEPCPSTGFHRVLAQHLPAQGRLLDVGCGDHDLLTRYRTPDRQAWGVDFNAHPALKDRTWFRRLTTDGTIPFPEASFDLVCSHMVMEHVSDPARYFQEITRVLKPGGVFIGQSIHGRHYVTWIRRLLGALPHRWVQRLVKTLYGRAEHDTFATCYRLNTRQAIGRVAADAYLKWEGWHGYANPGYFAFSPWLYRPAVLIDWGLERVLPGLGKIYFTVVLRKPRAPIKAPSHAEPWYSEQEDSAVCASW